MLNHIVIMGRMVRDPEKRSTGSGVSVANFTVAVDRDFADKQSGSRETDFIDCVAWRNTADFVCKHFLKGKTIVVSGRLQSRKWTDKDGNKRTAWEIQADNVYFGGDKEKQTDTSGPTYDGGGYPETMAYAKSRTNQNFDYPYPGSAPASDFAMLEDDDGNLPF